MKMTIERWIHELPDHIKEKAFSKENGGARQYAIENVNQHRTYSSVSVALNHFIIYANTVEGGDYWHKVYKHYAARINEDGMYPAITSLPTS